MYDISAVPLVSSDLIFKRDFAPYIKNVPYDGNCPPKRYDLIDFKDQTKKLNHPKIFSSHLTDASNTKIKVIRDTAMEI